MGNRCFKGSWTDKQTIQSWFPMLINLFVYNENEEIVAHKFTAMEQLKTLPVLLRGKAGVSKDTIHRLQRVYNEQQEANLEGGAGSMI
jgi:hypothetical protein